MLNFAIRPIDFFVFLVASVAPRQTTQFPSSFPLMMLLSSPSQPREKKRRRALEAAWVTLGHVYSNQRNLSFRVVGFFRVIPRPLGRLGEQSPSWLAGSFVIFLSLEVSFAIFLCLRRTCNDSRLIPYMHFELFCPAKTYAIFLTRVALRCDVQRNATNTSPSRFDVEFPATTSFKSMVQRPLHYFVPDPKHRSPIETATV